MRLKRDGREVCEAGELSVIGILVGEFFLKPRAETQSFRQGEIMIGGIQHGG